jgi:glycerate kinase
MSTFRLASRRGLELAKKRCIHKAGGILRVLVCHTAFKESLSAREVADAVTDGVRRALPDSAIIRMPVSDGGPGLLEALAEADGGEIRMHRVCGPLGDPVSARSLWVSRTEAAIETADACGLHLVPSASRDPMRADTRGVGELVARCLEQGATNVTLGLGGSATVDGGTGLGRVFGYRFLGPDGSDLPPGGGSLANLVRIEPGVLPGGELVLTAISDVRGPLSGPDGAARRFAPQKGANAAQVAALEAGLNRLGERLRDDLGRDVSDHPGAGASGGLGAGCAAFLGADLVSGSDWVLNRVGFDTTLSEADLVITGEGAWDATSSLGKITWEILRRATSVGVPALLVCGRVSGPIPAGVTAVGGDGAWLELDDVARLVADAVD